MEPQVHRPAETTGVSGAPGVGEVILEARDLHTRLETDRGWLHAIDGVDVTLYRGRTLGLVGESGSGKTVLARTMMGTLTGSQAEITGSVKFLGREMTTLPVNERRDVWGKEMSMVFQDPM